MGLGRRTPLQRFFLVFLLSLLSHSRVRAQPAPTPSTPAPPAQAAPPAIPPAPGPNPDAAPPPQEAPSDATAPPAEVPAPEEVLPAEGPPPEAAGAGAAGVIEAGAEAPMEAGPAGPHEPEPDSGDIVVTGSRIKRSPELAKSAPVAVIDRKQLERSGATNAADVVSQLTAAAGSGYQGAGSPLNQGGGAVGTVMVNLRGLGAGATLVLINGRRLVPTGGGGGTETFSDLSVIPLAAIERVEVLKGGGSAIYGADAVAGVVNIITRNSWDGLRLEADGQTTTRMDQQDLTLSGAWGARSEHARVSIATSYFRRTPLVADEREFGRVANVDQSGNPATFIAPGFDPSTPMRTRFADPACNSVPGSEIRHPIVNGMELPDEVCTFNYAKFQSIIPGMERGNIFASASYDISSHTTVFAEFMANRTRSDNLTTPAYSVPPPFLSVPANHIDNIFGKPVGFLGRPFGAVYGSQHNSYGDDTYRILTGLRGDFSDLAKDTVLESWEWELNASWATSRATSAVPDTLRANLQQALNSCSDPSNLSNCYNPFYSAVDGTGTPNSQAVYDKVFGSFMNITDHSLQTYFGNLTGMLFNLPGGEVGFALGGELRREWRQTQLDHDANQEAYSFILGNTDAYAERDIYSVFLELRWPLFKGIELNTAGRIEHYTDIEDTTPSPFVGLTVDVGELSGGRESAPAIIRRLQLVGQATWAFRAPSLYQAYPGYAIVPTSLQIPPAPVPVYTPVQNFGNPDLQPETALVLSAGFNWQLIDELNLRAEYWDYDYKNKIAVESAQQALANDLSSRANGGPGDPRVIHDPATGAVQKIQVTQRNIDGSVRTNGIDFGAMVTLTGATFGGARSDWGAINAGIDGTLTLNYTFPAQLAARRTIPNTVPAMTLDPLHCDAQRCNGVGSRNYQTFAPPLPRMKFNIPIGWGMNGHLITLIGHYLTSIEDDNAIGPDGSVGHLSAMFTLDAQYAYTVKDWIGKELTARIGVYNLTDQLPDQTHDLNGFETMLYDPRGAMVYAKVSALF
jgi:iron complex outermembrane receptor protein